MNKHKFTNSQILNMIIISILYVTWIVGIHVVLSISNVEDNHIIYTNIVGSLLALVFTVIMHYPLIPMFSRHINARIESEAVKIRRSYAIKALYTIIIGFFFCAFFLFLKLDDLDEHPLAASWGLVETAAALMLGSFAIITIQCWKKMKILVYVDKLQHKNADIES